MKKKIPVTKEEKIAWLAAHRGKSLSKLPSSSWLDAYPIADANLHLTGKAYDITDGDQEPLVIVANDWAMSRADAEAALESGLIDEGDLQ